MCCLVFPENTAHSIERQVRECLKTLHQYTASDDGARNGLALYERTALQGFQAASKALKATASQSKYEILWSKLSPTWVDSIHAHFDGLESHLRVIHTIVADFDNTDESKLAHGPVEEFLKDVIHLHRSQCQTAADALNSVFMSKKNNDLESGGCTKYSDVRLVLAKQVTELIACRKMLDLVSSCGKDAIIVCELLDVMMLVCHDLQRLVEETAVLADCGRAGRFLYWPKTLLPSFIHHIEQAEPRPNRRFSIASLPQFQVKVPNWLYIRYWTAHAAATFRDSRHTQYAFKFSLVMAILSIWPFIDDWAIWYRDVRGFWAMVFAMVVMETTRGLVFRTAMMKGIGAIGGGLFALAAYELAAVSCETCSRQSPSVYFLVAATFVCGLLLYFIALDPRFAKAGLVSALCFSLVLGVGFETSNAALAYVKRLAAQLTGIGVAVMVHVLVYPYHARKELKSEICNGLDELASAYSASSYGYDEPMAYKKARGHLQYAQSLIHFTKFEPSLKGSFPKALWAELVSEIGCLLDLISCQNDLAAGKTSPGARLRLHRALAQDLYLISHAKATRVDAIVSLCTNTAAKAEQLQALFKHRSSTFQLSYEARASLAYLQSIRARVQELLSGRSLPILLELAAQSEKASPFMSPSVSQQGSRRGSLAAPTLMLPTAMLSTATTQEKPQIQRLQTEDQRPFTAPDQTSNERSGAVVMNALRESMESTRTSPGVVSPPDLDLVTAEVKLN